MGRKGGGFGPEVNKGRVLGLELLAHRHVVAWAAHGRRQLTRGPGTEREQERVQPIGLSHRDFLIFPGFFSALKNQQFQRAS
jgi:hypothetical protein